ncbi:MAG: phasin family protein [Pseudomonadota bacterium]
MTFENMLPNAEKLTAMNKQMLDSVVKFGEIATDTHRKMATKQIAVLEANMSAFSKMVESMGALDKPADAYAQQLETAQSLGQELLSVAKETWEVQVEARDQLAALVTESAEQVRAETSAV